MPRLRVVRVRDWSLLPRVLEPGVYIVGSRRLTVLEPISRDSLVKALRRAPRRGRRI